MPFTFDFLDDGRVLEWETTTDGAIATEREDYSPRFYVASCAPDAEINLTRFQSVYERHPDVVTTDIVAQRPGFRRDDEDALAVDVTHINRSPRWLDRHASCPSILWGISPASMSISRGSFGTVSRTM